MIGKGLRQHGQWSCDTREGPRVESTVHICRQGQRCPNMIPRGLGGQTLAPEGSHKDQASGVLHDRRKDRSLPAARERLLIARRGVQRLALQGQSAHRDQPFRFCCVLHPHGVLRGLPQVTVETHATRRVFHVEEHSCPAPTFSAPRRSGTAGSDAPVAWRHWSVWNAAWQWTESWGGS